METLLAPGVIGPIVQGVAGILVAVITYVISPIAVERFRQRSEKLPHPKQPNSLVYALIAGGSGAVTFVVIGLLIAVLSPKPSVAITSPVTGQQVEVRLLTETGSGAFMVSGTSSEVFADPDLQVYVLVHPSDPFAGGWWIQQSATVDRNGQWTTQAWIGSKDFPPQIGHQVDILAVVADPRRIADRVWIANPKNIRPVAQSDIVRISLGSITKTP